MRGLLWGRIHGEGGRTRAWTQEGWLWGLGPSPLSSGLSLDKTKTKKNLFLSWFPHGPWRLLHKSVQHLQLVPGLSLPSGHRDFYAWWENLVNHLSLRACVLIRFILVCEYNRTLQLWYIFITCFIKNDSTQQMAQFRKEWWVLLSYDLALLIL